MIACLLLVALALLAPGIVEAAEGQTPAVRLNEILADPNADWDGNGAYQSRDDEWVEIVNAGAVTVDLTGYRLAGADTSWRYEFSGSLAPGEVRVVYGSASYAWEQAHGAPAFGLRLANTGGTITLWTWSATDSALVDAYTYEDHEAEDQRSTGRFPDGGDTWKLFDSLNPYTGTVPPLGSSCAPSPGGSASCPTDVIPSTWGGIKGQPR